MIAKTFQTIIALIFLGLTLTARADRNAWLADDQAWLAGQIASAESAVNAQQAIVNDLKLGVDLSGVFASQGTADLKDAAKFVQYKQAQATLDNLKSVLKELRGALKKVNKTVKQLEGWGGLPAQETGRSVASNMGTMGTYRPSIPRVDVPDVPDAPRVKPMTNPTAPRTHSSSPKPRVRHASPGRHCFVAGTLVQTPNGPTEIQDIRAGNLVLSFNESTQAVEPARVLRVIQDRRADLVEVRTPGGSVTCSQNHRFQTGTKGWVQASSLQSTDRVLHLDSSAQKATPLRVSTTRATKFAPVRVYNFTVENNPNYFVGPDAILCHNRK